MALFVGALPPGAERKSPVPCVTSSLHDPHPHTRDELYVCYALQWIACLCRTLILVGRNDPRASWNGCYRGVAHSSGGVAARHETCLPRCHEHPPSRMTGSHVRFYRRRQCAGYLSRQRGKGEGARGVRRNWETETALPGNDGNRTGRRAIDPSYLLLHGSTYVQAVGTSWMGQGSTSVARKLAYCRTRCEA